MAEASLSIGISEAVGGNAADTGCGAGGHQRRHGWEMGVAMPVPVASQEVPREDLTQYHPHNANGDRTYWLWGYSGRSRS